MSGRERPGALATVLRVAWGRRLETGLVLVTVVARTVLSALVGLHIAQLELAVSAAMFLAYGPSRRWLVGLARREELDRWFGKAMARSGLHAEHLPGLLHVRSSASGYVLSVVLSPGLTAEGLSKQTERVAVAFGARSVRVARDPANARRAELLVSYTDPLSVEVPWPWTGLGPTDGWTSFPLATSEDGGAVFVGLPEHHLLIGGEPGAGKSNALSLVVAAIAADSSVELWLFDGKLVELAPWRDVARRFVGADVTEATAALAELRAEMDVRYRQLLSLGRRKVTKDDGLGLVVVVIDELALYLQGPKAQRDAFAEALRDLVARGRAAGVVVVAATQKPSSDVVPTSIRDLFGYRLALRCATKEASDTVLGSGWAAEGYSASAVDAATRGVGWLLAEGSLPVRVRCYRLDDDALARCIDTARTLRDRGQSP